MRWSACVIACLGCAGSAASKAVPASVPAPAAVSAEHVEPFASDREIRDLVNGWFQAARQRELAKLRALYAPDARITLRLGDEARELALDEYLRMIGLEMRVRVDASMELPLETVHAATGARVRYRFSWSSAAHALHGYKELTVVRLDGELRILKEEILESKVLRSNSGKSAFAGTALVTSDDEPRAIVGRAELADPDHGPVAVWKTAEAWVVSAPALLSDTPAGVQAWGGRRVRVIYESGEVCSGGLSPLEYAIHLEPSHAQEALVLESTGEENPAPTPMEPALAAGVLWDEAEQRPIAGRLQMDTEETCVGKPLVVRDASLPADHVARPMAVARAGELIGKFRELPEHKEIQGWYEDLVAEGKLSEPQALWDERTPPTLRAFRFEGAQETLVSLTLNTGGCGDWTPSIWVVFAVRDTGEIDVRSVLPRAAPTATLLILDIGSDAQLEYVGRMLNGQLALIDSAGDILDKVPVDWPSGC